MHIDMYTVDLYRAVIIVNGCLFERGHAKRGGAISLDHSVVLQTLC